MPLDSRKSFALWIKKNDMGGSCSTYGGREEVHAGLWWGNLNKRDNLEDTDVDGRLMLKWDFRNWDREHGLDWSGAGDGQVASSCKHGNEPSGSIKYGGISWLTENRLASQEGPKLCGVSKYCYAECLVGATCRWRPPWSIVGMILSKMTPNYNWRFSSYCTVNTFGLSYRNKSINAV